MLYGEAGPAPDVPLAARAAFMMFENVQQDVMAWSFVSPPARFRPGPRTGRYEVFVDELPLAKHVDGEWYVNNLKEHRGMEGEEKTYSKAGF